MSYTALYRKFRPGEFEDVKGQDHISTTLQNQIRAGRIGHAYLFCGTRGTGKTSVAKIFAKAVNCLAPVNGSPCGECEMCRAIAAGTSMNVIEIDAASNNGVDNIREIREEVAYRPTEGRYKVYIIDEVHMLSIGAFNALLKTLEEPPEYVIFILATTEVHKIPITILSRCQRYDFKRISIDTIADRLSDLMKAEQIDVEDRAIRYIAKVADGSMRDALSLLDQCIAFYLGQKLTYDHVLEVLGAVDTAVFSKMLRQMLNRDVSAVLATLDELIMQGRELTQLTADFTWYLRNLLLAKSSDNMEDVLDVSTENLKQLQEEADMVEYDMLLRYIRIFSELNNQLKYATQKRVLLEVTLIKICKPEMETKEDTVLDRIRAVEEKIESGLVQAAPVMVTGGQPVSVEQNTPKVELPKALHADVQAVVQQFSAIRNQVSGILKVVLKKARLSVGNQDQLLLVFDDEVQEQLMMAPEHIQEVEEAIEEQIGKHVKVEVRHVERGRRFEDSFVDIAKLIHMDLTIED